MLRGVPQLMAARLWGRCWGGWSHAPALLVRCEGKVLFKKRVSKFGFGLFYV